MNNFWTECARTLQQELPPQQFATWIRPIAFVSFDEAEGCVRLSAPNRVKLDWVQKQFSARIEALAEAYWNAPVRVEFEIAAKAGNQFAALRPGGARAPALPTPMRSAALTPAPATPPSAAADTAPSAIQPLAASNSTASSATTAATAAAQNSAADSTSNTPDSTTSYDDTASQAADAHGSTVDQPSAEPAAAPAGPDLSSASPTARLAARLAARLQNQAADGSQAGGASSASTNHAGSDDDHANRTRQARQAQAAGQHQGQNGHQHGAQHNAQNNQPHQERARLNQAWTFDTFVIGKANQLARAAALQVAENPGSGYNPLFLYGGVGLGKSHLIHAVGNALVARDPASKVRYIHAETYVSDVVRAYQRKSFDEFKRYYHSLDLLLIDDIQFFSGKSRTQEEFFYAFEALIAARKQIIITSDTYPKELGGIDDRLISRFDSGLTVAIEPPELEMRVAILLKKAELQGVELGEEPAFFVAKHLRSNVRELEGALLKIIAFARFNNVPITLDTVKTALKDVLQLQKTLISVEGIQKTVADYYKIKIADMYSKRRPANIALPRQIAMYLAKELTQKSLPEIGELFGGRDHTTVLHAVKKIAEHRQRNAELNHQLHVLEQTLRS